MRLPGETQQALQDTVLAFGLQPLLPCIIKLAQQLWALEGVSGIDAQLVACTRGMQLQGPVATHCSR